MPEEAFYEEQLKLIEEVPDNPAWYAGSTTAYHSRDYRV